MTSFACNIAGHMWNNAIMPLLHACLFGSVKCRSVGVPVLEALRFRVWAAEDKAIVAAGSCLENSARGLALI
jgi:hypothetical protein